MSLKMRARVALAHRRAKGAAPRGAQATGAPRGPAGQNWEASLYARIVLPEVATKHKGVKGTTHHGPRPWPEEVETAIIEEASRRFGGAKELDTDVGYEGGFSLTDSVTGDERILCYSYDSIEEQWQLRMKHCHRWLLGDLYVVVQSIYVAAGIEARIELCW